MPDWNVRFKNWGDDGKVKVLPIKDYIRHRLKNESEGIAETGISEAISAQKALGRLVNLLSIKGILSQTDVMEIVNCPTDQVEFVPDWFKDKL